MSTVWKSEDEDICIMERPASKFFYMRVKRPDNGKWVQKSSKRTTVEGAKQEAFKWQAVMSDRIDRGVSATSVPFKVLCDRYIKEIDDEIAQSEATDGQEGRNQKDLRDYKTIVKRYNRENARWDALYSQKLYERLIRLFATFDYEYVVASFLPTKTRCIQPVHQALGNLQEKGLLEYSVLPGPYIYELLQDRLASESESGRGAMYQAECEPEVLDVLRSQIDAWKRN